MRTEDQTPVFEWRALGAVVERLCQPPVLSTGPWRKGPYN